MNITGEISTAAKRDTQIFLRPALEAVIQSFETGPHQVAIDCNPDLKLLPETTSRLCDVTKEAVDNALRHAFPNHIKGRIWVRIFEDRGRLTLSIRDNGIGMPDFTDYSSGGRARIFAAAEELHAHVRMGVAPFSGALVSIMFPASA